MPVFRSNVLRYRSFVLQCFIILYIYNILVHFAHYWLLISACNLFYCSSQTLAPVATYATPHVKMTNGYMPHQIVSIWYDIVYVTSCTFQLVLIFRKFQGIIW